MTILLVFVSAVTGENVISCCLYEYEVNKIY